MKKETGRKTTKNRLRDQLRLLKTDRYPNTFVLICFGLASLAGFLLGLEYAFSLALKGFSTIAPQCVTVIGGAIAGILALWQYNRSHQQRDEQYRGTQLQDQFGDIQDRLTSTEPIIRANAALRLAQFGTTLAPQASAGDQRNEENNPYFVPVASQLATALYLEPNQAIRKAVREAIKNLIEFGKTDDAQPLLCALIERLVDANRAARDNFIRALAEYTIYGAQATEERAVEGKRKKTAKTKLDLGFVTSLAPFCTEAEHTSICLQLLMAHGEGKNEAGEVITESAYTVQCLRLKKMRGKQTPDEDTKAVASAIPSLLMSGQQVIDSRDALAEALRALSEPHGLPKNVTGEIDLDLLNNWQRSPAIDINRCVLAGAHLSKAQLQKAHVNGALLQGADLDRAQLQGAYLYSTQFQGADLSGADLRGSYLDEGGMQEVDLQRAQLQVASLRWAELQRAYLPEARLQGADLTYADLEGADLSLAQLQEANLEFVQLQGADLSDVDMQGADLRCAELQGADLSYAQLQNASLYGVYILFPGRKGEMPTKLPKNTLSVARFEPEEDWMRNDEADKRTKELVEWLKRRREEEEAKVEPPDGDEK